MTSQQIPLMPLSHQVGGHAAFLRFSSEAVCKPYSAKEHYFYAQLPHPLRPFTPDFLGVVRVEYDRDDGQPHLVLSQMQHCSPQLRALIDRVLAEQRQPPPPPTIDSSTINTDSMMHQYAVQSHNALSHPSNADASIVDLSGEMGVFAMDDEVSIQQLLQQSDTMDSIVINQTPVSSDYRPPLPRSALATPIPSSIQRQRQQQGDSSEQDNTPYINPWSLHLYASHLANTRSNSFLLLSDLTAHFQHPCILDLKMGTRQHGIGVSPEKRQRQLDKVRKSTSARWGVRVCGMQVYDLNKRTYRFQDKYYGRTLKSDQELRAVLVAFLDADDRISHSDVISRGRVEFLPVLIDKLKRLRRIIKSLDGYRFFASSLLLVYDASPSHLSSTDSTPDEEVGDVIRVKMVDFARSVNRQKSEDLKLRVLKRLRRRPLLHHACIPLHTHFPTLTATTTTSPTTTTTTMTPSHTISDTTSPPPLPPRSLLFSALDLIPHLTRAEMEDRVLRVLQREESDDLCGFDEGYVTGLDTLVRLFEDIYQCHSGGGGGDRGGIKSKGRSVAGPGPNLKVFDSTTTATLTAATMSESMNEETVIYNNTKAPSLDLLEPDHRVPQNDDDLLELRPPRFDEGEERTVRYAEARRRFEGLLVRDDHGVDVDSKRQPVRRPSDDK